jgi:hypothetical protein
VELPRTLHAQLYLLAYDRDARRFQFDRTHTKDTHGHFRFALRAAILTDLYLAGFVEDKNGKANPTGTSRPDDPVLDEALQDAAAADWFELIRYGGHRACKAVRAQLEAAGWVHGSPSRMMGIISERVGLYDEDLVGGLTDRVTEALRNVLDDRPADPRPLALGLIAVQAQMPFVDGFIHDIAHRHRLREMTLAAIEPILALHQVIQEKLADRRAEMGYY